MNKNEYLKNPCRSLSIPFWKSKIFKIPDNIVIIHQEDFSNQYRHYQRFFRLIHDLKNISPRSTELEYLNADHLPDLAKMINDCYAHENITITEETLSSFTKSPTYRKNLWLCIREKGDMVASGIAEFDEDCKEGILEWIQVLPEYQNKGYGTTIVNGLLYELKLIGADFTTVSGNADNLTNPRRLYEKCGFVGNDIWYICQK